jgi:hypothetical protein
MIVNGIAENRILPHLLNEGGIGKYVCSSQEVDIGGDHNSPAVEDDEKQQKNMIENFKSTVIKQQQIKTSHIVPARGISVQQAKSFMENQRFLLFMILKYSIIRKTFRKNVPLKNPPHLMSHSQPCLVYTTASAANNYPQSES